VLAHRTLSGSNHTMFHWRQRKAFVIVTALILLGIGVVSYILQPASVATYQAAAPDTLPSQLSDVDFWEMIESFSEPNGYFRSDNFLSNESGLQSVVPKVRERIQPGNVYIGVGPEQNFTYILAFQPKISFVIDIRRLNMLEHLLYKAIFELSQDRADFVSSLFSRPRPKGLTEKATVEELFKAYDDVASNNALLETNLERVRAQLLVTHHFPLSEEDVMQIRYVLSNFAQEGPDLTYSFLGTYYQGTLGMPTYRQLMADNDGKGHNWSFLATEDAFRKIQDIQRKNLIVPLVGDFAGPKTIRSVGRYMRQHDALLSVFYTSNVEMYLFQQGNDWKNFYENVATLPLNPASTFVRFAAGRGRRFGSTGGIFGGMRSQMWSPVLEVIQSVRDRDFDDYAGVLDMSE
jgi:hypothetical protein